jgi:hypothetical protein
MEAAALLCLAVLMALLAAGLVVTMIAMDEERKEGPRW